MMADDASVLPERGMLIVTTGKLGLGKISSVLTAGSSNNDHDGMSLHDGWDRVVRNDVDWVCPCRWYAGPAP